MIHLGTLVVNVNPTYIFRPTVHFWVRGHMGHCTLIPKFAVKDAQTGITKLVRS
jgi:hypothetical protein